MAKKKLLIIHQGALGDFVATFPAIVGLRKRFHRIDVLCQSELGRLAVELRVADRWFPVESASFASLYSGQIDPGIKKILSSYHDIILFTFSVELKQAIVPIAQRRVHRIPPRANAPQKIHIAEHILSNLVSRDLLEKNNSDFHSILFSAGRLDRRDPSSGLPKIMIHPGSGSRKKLWPVLNFMKIDTTLRADGLKPEFILGPAEHFLAEVLVKNNAQQRVVHTIDNLSQLVILLKEAGGFIGNDSGVSHLAAFMGLPAVAVFGPSDPERWKPLGRSVKIVRPDLDCTPCFEVNINDCNTMECFNKTTPEMVLNAFFSLVNGDHPDSGLNLGA